MGFVGRAGQGARLGKGVDAIPCHPAPVPVPVLCSRPTPTPAHPIPAPPQGFFFSYTLSLGAYSEQPPGLQVPLALGPTAWHLASLFVCALLPLR